MVHKVGLLPAYNYQQVPFAYNMYTRTDNVGWEQSKAFKKAFSIDVEIEFVGVWDTVNSVGLIPKRLPFVSSNTAIRYFRHAVSLDEHRAKFKANLYNRPTEEEAKLGVQPGDMPKPNNSVPTSGSIWNVELLKDLYKKVEATRPKNSAQEEEEQHSRLETSYDMDEKSETDVLEVWFAGCHCDVGGGSVPNDTPHNLARIPLRWMIRECFLANTGIRFHTDLLRNVGLDPASLYPVVRPRPPEIYATAEKLEALRALEASYKANNQHSGASAAPMPTISTSSTSTPIPPPMHERSDSTRTLVNGEDAIDTVAAPYLGLTEEEEDLLDAVCPVYDQLELAKAWWLLEVIPLVQRHQEEDNTWVDELVINWGRPRHIPRPTAIAPFRVHRSVKMRIAAEGLVETTSDKKSSYEPRAKLRDNPIWVD
ncbi:hypothetical protein EIP86_009153 [Pleurotus ostreatoroseus]|nr:hypothetical protein EIP86_009153 [Pleurotus ostreatoroseus]